MLRKLPDWRSVLDGNTELAFSTRDVLDAENERINQLINNEDIENIISRYPIRETPALGAVARALGFQSQSKYEQSVRKMLIDSPEARQQVIGLLQPVSDLIRA